MSGNDTGVYPTNEPSAQTLRDHALREVRDRIASESDRGQMSHIRSDFDGTAALLTPFPEEARPHPVFTRAQQRMADLDFLSVGLITSRDLEFTKRLFPDGKIELACSNGAEKRVRGEEFRAPHIATGTDSLTKIKAAVVNALADEGVGYSESSREAAANGLLYIETAATKVAVHTRAGLTKNSDLPVVLERTLGRLSRSDDQDVRTFYGLVLKDNNMNVEFDLRTVDGRPVDKRDEVAALMGLVPGRANSRGKVQYELPAGGKANFVVYSGDDKGDIEAAKLVRQHEGVVLVVRQQGTPEELLDQATVVFDSVAQHAGFQMALATSLERLHHSMTATTSRLSW